MEIITSTQNRLVKLARSLAERKFRLETGLFLVEGVNLLKDLRDDVAIEFVFATQVRYDEASEMLANHSVKEGIFCVSDAVMDCVSDTASPYGIAAVCKIPSVRFGFPKGNALLLDGVSDPGNVGTILRTAAACGFEDVYTLNCADIYSPKVIRATLGALFKISVCEINEEQALCLLKNLNGAVLDMDGQNLLESKIPSPILFVAGSEAHGVRETLKREAKSVYSLPMKNQIESLNVAVATAVAMYQTL
ncbi:MAG: RNA methyltransferase [Bacteroides sp.]|nr:RNA methyltransferase [Bacillota bacterium]MCM1393891.1 RNA methyltransferase [[Eubacterium] siraeum]MCM1455331.1 RNA methyltransferase [Bacteroides sp.]